MSIYEGRFTPDFGAEEPINAPAGLKRCRYTAANGRRCRLVCVDELGFCARHRSFDEELVAMELFLEPNEFKTAVGLNRFLAKLTQLTTANRIPVRSAAALSFMAQLLLQTLDRAKSEIEAVHPGAYEKLVASAIAKDESLSPILADPCTSIAAAPVQAGGSRNDAGFDAVLQHPISSTPEQHWTADA